MTTSETNVPKEWGGIPGFRRRIRIIPGVGQASAALEDDLHCMLVTLQHDGERITGVEPVMDRAPWTTCPGARAVLRGTFLGLPLAEAQQRAAPEKRQNCTHLHDLALLAAAHAGDREGLVYDVLAGDPVDGEQSVELRKDGKRVQFWHLRDGSITMPEGIAGRSLTQLRDWIATLDTDAAEAARILQWASLVAHGRTMPLSRQSNAQAIPPNCHTFQPEQAAVAQRVGQRIDFSRALRAPLEHFDGATFHDDPHRAEHPEPPTPA